MSKKIFKSFGAVITGFLIGGILSFATDYVLESAGILPKNNLYVPTLLIIGVLFYRSVFIIIGCFISARLAPNHHMRHAMVGGVIGFLLSVLGAIVTSSMDIGPTWYAWVLALLTLPSAWVGGRLYQIGISRIQSKNTEKAM